MAEGLNPLLAYAAGALTILSPCVLPLVPIVIAAPGGAINGGPSRCAPGWSVSFTAVGFVVAAFGASLGFDARSVRLIGAVMLLLVGLVLVIPQAQALLTRAPPARRLGGSAAIEARTLRRRRAGGIGVLLGVVWSRASGPTLGAATVLAAQGENLVEVAIVMAAFGLGIASVLLLLAFATRGFLTRWRGRLMTTGGRGRQILGGLLVFVALLILTGADRLIEGLVVELSPDWLNDLTTAILERVVTLRAS